MTVSVVFARFRMLIAMEWRIDMASLRSRVSGEVRHMNTRTIFDLYGYVMIEFSVKLKLELTNTIAGNY